MLILPASFQASQGNAFSWSGVSTSKAFTPWKRLMSSFQFHGSDLTNAFLGGGLRDYILRFADTLDPNGREGLGVFWPQWDPAKPKALIFKNGVLFPIVTGDDNYRSQPLDYVANMSLRYPI